MKTILFPVIKALWRMRIEQFWPIWVFITGVAATGVACLVGRGTISKVAKGENPLNFPARSSTRSWGTIAALTLLTLIILGYIVVTLKWEDFANYDEAYYTLYTLRGHNFAPPIWRQNGRFFPLCHQEFNLIRHFTHTVAGYHAVPLIQLLIVACFILILDDELSIATRGALAAFALILPSFVISFTGLVFPERNIVFWLMCLVFFVKRFEQTNGTKWAVAATICAQFMIYYKETAFLIVLGFALGRLIFRFTVTPHSRGAYDQFRDKQTRLDLSLVSLSLVFLVYYFAVMIPHVNMQYAHEEGISLATMFPYTIKADPLAWLFVATVIGRTYLILRGRVQPLPLWDGLALGGILCFVAYFILRLSRIYYMAPVDLIAVLYVGRFAFLIKPQIRSWKTVPALVLGSTLFLYGGALSAFSVFERKNVVHANVRLAGVIAAQSQSDPSHVTRLFFPFSAVYPITEFAAYLVYKGVPVEGGPDNIPGSKSVAIVTKTSTVDQRCVDYRDFICHAANVPAPGDLVIELPDDPESRADINPYRKGGESLLTYTPHPSMPRRIYSLFSCLHLISAQFRFEEPPDRWLDASVTKWR